MSTLTWCNGPVTKCAPTADKLSGVLEAMASDLPDGAYSPDPTAPAGARLPTVHCPCGQQQPGRCSCARQPAVCVGAAHERRHGTFGVLASLDVPQRDDALAAFHAATGDHLLVDKWFTLHALRPGTDAASHVRKLTGHDDFSIARPNRVRALIGAFAGMNQAGFNAASGEGYDLVAEVIMRLDERNPQVAARMAGGFRSYQIMEAGRRARRKRRWRASATRMGFPRTPWKWSPGCWPDTRKKRRCMHMAGQKNFSRILPNHPDFESMGCSDSVV
jgi:aminopeptidase N